MSRIRGKNTRPEMLVRSVLHRLGYRFRIHSPRLPGKPDIVLPKHRTVVFVHGCFWHRHPACKYAYQPKTRVEFWSRKFADNIRRHAEVTAQLTQQGWRVVVVWECELNSLDELRGRLSRILSKGCSATDEPGNADLT